MKTFYPSASRILIDESAEVIEDAVDNVCFLFLPLPYFQAPSVQQSPSVQAWSATSNLPWADASTA